MRVGGGGRSKPATAMVWARMRLRDRGWECNARAREDPTFPGLRGTVSGDGEQTDEAVG